jgi:hypothetical protein
MKQTRHNVPRDYLQHLRNLRAQGYADAEEKHPDRSELLPGPAERLEYDVHTVRDSSGASALRDICVIRLCASKRRGAY